MERLKQAVTGSDLHRELSEAFFEAAQAQVETFLADVAKKPMTFTPPIRAAILAHMEEWRGVFEHDGTLPSETMIAAMDKAGQSFAWAMMDEDLREQVAMNLPAEQPDEAA
jgi:hypothetical protein